MVVRRSAALASKRMVSCGSQSTMRTIAHRHGYVDLGPPLGAAVDAFCRLGGCRDAAAIAYIQRDREPIAPRQPARGVQHHKFGARQGNRAGRSGLPQPVQPRLPARHPPRGRDLAPAALHPGWGNGQGGQCGHSEPPAPVSPGDGGAQPPRGGRLTCCGCRRRICTQKVQMARKMCGTWFVRALLPLLQAHNGGVFWQHPGRIPRHTAFVLEPGA